MESWRTDAPVELEPWLDALDEYVEQRDDAGPIDGWFELWPAAPDREDEEPVGPDEERPPHGTSACAIGRRAGGVSVHLGDVERDETAAADDDNELDDFSWSDAARWSPADIARDNVEDGQYTSDQLDAEMMARDWEIEGLHVVKSGSDVHVFSTCA